jgi:PAS domain S-box-containing protein
VNDDLRVINDPAMDHARNGAMDDQRREQELRVLAERFRDCAEIGPQWFWEVDGDLRYTYMSDRGIEMFGLTAQQIFGRRRAELLIDATPMDETEWRTYLADLNARRPFYKIRYLMSHPGGASAYIMTSARPFFDASGAFCGYRGVSIDITEQVKAESQLRAAIEAIEDGFAYFDSEERFVLCNSKYLDFYPNAVRILQPGTTFEDIVRNGITRGLVRASTPSIEEYVQRRLKQFRSGTETFDGQIEDGRWLRIQDRRTADGGTACFRVDITDLKRREASLTLERETSDAQNRAKTEFLSSMSHELRTPMNAILGFGRLLEQKSTQLTPEKVSNFATHIVRSGQHLLNLIGDVLELSKIEAGHANFTIEDVVAPPLIAECVDMLKEKAYEVDVTLIDDSAADLPPLATDRGRFRQIMLNLLSNAVKYNRAGGTVTVATQVMNDTVHNTGMIRVSVADTGDGIPLERQPQIFQPFNRLGREGSGIEGTGIGLYLTHRLVAQLGGAIGFDSVPGQGTTFWVDFPVGGAAWSIGPVGVQAAHTPASAADEDGYFTVLYIEDNPLHRLLMEEVFADLTNARLVTANDAESGIELAGSLHPALILMDIDLPGMSGVQARAHLAEARETASIPVVALTAGAADYDMQRGLDAGFGDYLTKPFDIERLLGVIERFTGATRV